MMPRRLPWSIPGRDGNPAPKKSQTTASPSPGIPIAGSSTRKVAPAANLSAKAAGKKRADRTPSTSPPPAPPKEELMIDGPENDDKYRMVEDEFVGVANLFTAHLHAAEYKRLKEQARSQNAESIRNMSRPVIGPLTEAARRRKEQNKLSQRQRHGLKQAVGKDNDEGSGDEIGEIARNGSSLQGLMSSPQKMGLPLATLTSTSKSTRAAAGFSRSQTSGPPQRRKPAAKAGGGDSSETESDLDLTSKTSNKKTTARSMETAVPLVAGIKRARTVPGTAQPTLQMALPAKKATTWERAKSSALPPSSAPEVEEDDQESVSSDSDTFNLAKRRKERKARTDVARTNAAQKGKREVKDESIDAIPSFL